MTPLREKAGRDGGREGQIMFLEVTWLGVKFVATGKSLKQFQGGGVPYKPFAGYFRLAEGGCFRSENADITRRSRPSIHAEKK